MNFLKFSFIAERIWSSAFIMVALILSKAMALDGNGTVHLDSINPDWVGFEVLTSGDDVSAIAPAGYTQSGIFTRSAFDGLGVYVNNDQLEVFINHESFPATISRAILPLANLRQAIDNKLAPGSNPFPSQLVTSLSLAYETIFSVSYHAISAPAPAASGLDDCIAYSDIHFDRFCSATTFLPESFGSGRGFTDIVHLTGEEVGGGTAVALDVETRTLWEIPDFGTGNWENFALIDTKNSTHVGVVLLEDIGVSPGATLKLYVGEKNVDVNNDGLVDFLERNGLRGGSIYYFQSNSGQMALPSGQDSYRLTQNETLGIEDRKIEDGHTNPQNPSQIVFAAQINGIYTLTLDLVFSGNQLLADVNDPNASTATIDQLLNVSVAAPDSFAAPDNVTWSSGGQIFVQEDGGATPANEIWRFSPDDPEGTLTRIADGKFETSGIIDISAEVNCPPGTVLMANVMGGQQDPANPDASASQLFVLVSRENINLPGARTGLENYTQVSMSDSFGTEGSGLTYYPPCHFLAVDDGTNMILRLNSDGSVNSEVALTSNLDDLEGITYLKGNLVAYIEEERRKLHIIDMLDPTNSTVWDLSADIGGMIGEDGIEGLSFDPLNNILYFVIEWNSNNDHETGSLWRMPLDLDSRGPVLDMNGNQVPPTQIPLHLSPTAAIDLAGVYFNPFTNTLLLLSQESKRIIEVDTDGNYLGHLDVPQMIQPEGITMDGCGRIFLLGEGIPSQFAVFESPFPTGRVSCFVPDSAPGNYTGIVETAPDNVLGDIGFSGIAQATDGRYFIINDRSELFEFTAGRTYVDYVYLAEKIYGPGPINTILDIEGIATISADELAIVEERELRIHIYSLSSETITNSFTLNIPGEVGSNDSIEGISYDMASGTMVIALEIQGAETGGSVWAFDLSEARSFPGPGPYNLQSNNRVPIDASLATEQWKDLFHNGSSLFLLGESRNVFEIALDGTLLSTLKLNDVQSVPLFSEPTGITIDENGTLHIVGEDDEWGTYQLTQGDSFASVAVLNGIGGAELEGDENGDGISNAMAYAMCLPMSGEFSCIYRSMLPSIPANDVTVAQWSMPSQPPGNVTYIMEESFEMLVWQEIARKEGDASWSGGLVTEGTPADGRIPVEVGIPTTASRKFVRLRVEVQ